MVHAETVLELVDGLGSRRIHPVSVEERRDRSRLNSTPRFLVLPGRRLSCSAERSRKCVRFCHMVAKFR